MKEILIKRIYQSFGMINHKVVFENGTQLLLENGETIRVKLDQLPIKAYVKQGLLRSRDFTIDDSTNKLIVKNDVSKNLIGPGLPLLTFLSTFLPSTNYGFTRDFPRNKIGMPFISTSLGTLCIHHQT